MGGVAVVALLVASCAGSSGSGSGGAATTPSAPAPLVTTQAPKPLQQPSVRCGASKTKATLVRCTAADGSSLEGVMVGSGPVGVVLAHEYQADLCNAWPFADYLAKGGLGALAVDLGCFGLSACPRARPPAGWSRTCSPPPPSCAAAASPGWRWSGRPWAARRRCSPPPGCSLWSMGWSSCRARRI